MKLCNIQVGGAVHLGLVTERGVVDATAAGCPLCMDQVIAGADRTALAALAADESLPLVAQPCYADVVNRPGKLLCVGLNYRAHAQNAGFALPEHPVLFSKFANALAPSGAAVELPDWEESYDYEAELVIVMGKTAWNVSEAEAMDCVFGYTCGNDLSCRDPQMRSGQWLIGKTMPGFAPCGPCIVTADRCSSTLDSYIRKQARLRADAGKNAGYMKNLYIDKVSGIISQENYLDLMKTFNAEKERCEAELIRVGKDIVRMKEQISSAGTKEDMIKKYLRCDALTFELVRVFIEKIVVYPKRPYSRETNIEIFWNI